MTYETLTVENLALLVVEDTTHEVLYVDGGINEVLEVESAPELLEVLVRSSELLTVAADPELLTVETISYEVLQLDEVHELLEIAEQGPPGPPGPTAASYPGKTLVYSQGVLTEVRLYSDAAKTQLAERRVLTYTGDVLTSIAFYDVNGTLTKTRTLGYSSGVLTSVTEA